MWHHNYILRYAAVYIDFLSDIVCVIRDTDQMVCTVEKKWNSIEYFRNFFVPFRPNVWLRVYVSWTRVCWPSPTNLPPICCVTSWCPQLETRLVCDI